MHEIYTRSVHTKNFFKRCKVTSVIDNQDLKQFKVSIYFYNLSKWFILFWGYYVYSSLTKPKQFNS